jgi:hypothetical protein
MADKITFVCRCGKHLRARKDMASRRVLCPRCGSSVGVPSGQPNHPGGLAGPLSPEEIARRRMASRPGSPPEEATQVLGPISVRLRRSRNLNALNPPDWRPLDAPLVCPPQAATPDGKAPVADAPGSPRRRRRSWQLETRWHHCLTYPCRAWPLVAGLALALTALSAAAVLLLPKLHEFHSQSLEGGLPALLGLLPLIILGYTAGFLDLVLAGAGAGEFQDVRWPGYDLRLVVRSAVRWLVCFLAGPVVPAAVAYWFWMACGEPTFVDRAILAELALVTVGSWLLALLAVTDADRLRAAAPPDVVAMFVRLGPRVAVPLLVVPILLFVHARLALAGIEDLHRDAASGVLLLAGAWLGVLFFGTFLFRLLGLWCHRSRRPAAS